MISKTILIFFFFLGASTANPVNIDWRIVGGSAARPGQFPFVCSLRTPSDSHNCGGTIITKEWVLTAAHCVSGYPTSYYTIVVGSNQLNSTDVTRVGVAEIQVHPLWNSLKIENDVALIKLSEPLELTNLIQTIDELEKEYVDESRNCIVIGWGRLSASGIIPNDLQYLESRTIILDQCQSLWTSNQVFATQVCALTHSGEGACYGDSGGPLIVVINGVRIQIGIVSWGSPCAVGMPDVYTRVASFYDWIASIINN